MKKHEIDPPAIVRQHDDRTLKVMSELQRLNTSLVDATWEVAQLLSEAKANDYPLRQGYNTFGSYLADTGLDLSEREAYYRIKIVDNSRALQIPVKTLKKAKLSTLKEIFTLSSEKYPEQIKRLVERAASGGTLEEIRQLVADIKHEGGEEVFVYRTYKLQKNVAEGVVDEAIEEAKAMRGDTMDPETKDLKEPSDGQAIEDICSDFLAGNRAHRQAEMDSIPDDPETET